MTLDELIAHKFVPREQVLHQQKLRKGCLVFTNGVFDLVHPGHLDYLSRAREMGDQLWIGLNSDDSVRRLKGPERPVNPQSDRLALLVCLEFVDYLTIFTEDTPEGLLADLRPDIHIKGGDYAPEDLPEKAVVEKHGGRVCILPFREGYSSTKIIQRIQGR
jgi:rfaE bifunctional protein nucleotidyltransferase chain/domain